MKFFNFSHRNSQDSSDSVENNRQSEPVEMYAGQSEAKEAKPNPIEIPEKLFVEYQKPNKLTDTSNGEPENVNSLRFLYVFLERNFEKKGYEDALINPDTSYMEENIVNIRNELSLIVSKTRVYYTRYLRTIDFHIDTRRRNGMIETVEELLAYRENIEEEFRIVTSIEEDSVKGIGLSENPILSYKKGFRNGFAAITYNTILANRDSR